MQGSILNQTYLVQTQLSKRGSRETYLAQNIVTDEPVVIKTIEFGFDAAWQDFKLFEREARTLQNINHPAIPDYLDYFELDLPNYKGFVLVQEYIAASSLEAVIKAGRTFSESDLQQIAEKLLNILIYLHQQQPSIIHRDIKPSNILLADRTGNSVGQVYLIDFGAVKNAAVSEGGTITVVGTYGYMPPEQFGCQTTHASDLFSLGATLIYLATGKHPTELPSKNGKIAFESSVQLSHLFVSWLNRAIELNCDRRWQSATEALQALKYPLVETEVEALKQPKFSRMKLHKTAEEINVVVPSQGFTSEIIFHAFFALFWNSFMLVWTGLATFGGTPLGIGIIMLLFSSPFWLIGLGLISSILFILFGKTRLRINSQKISLTHECLGIRYQKPKAASRRDIDAIECTETDWNAEQREKVEISSAVIIWANGRAYTLTTTVKRQTTLADKITNYDPASIELNWLAGELSRWLKLPLTCREVQRF